MDNNFDYYGFNPVEITDEQIRKNLKEAREKDEEYNANLYNQSKPFEELVVPVLVVVDKIISSSHNTHVRPMSEAVCGGRSPSYDSGQVINLEISVSSHPIIKKITFSGYCNLRRYDLINAYIFLGKEEKLKGRGLFDSFQSLEEAINNMHNPQPDFVYLPREPNETEKALKIARLMEGTEVEIYHSA